MTVHKIIKDHKCIQKNRASSPNFQPRGGGPKSIWRSTWNLWKRVQGQHRHVTKYSAFNIGFSFNAFPGDFFRILNIISLAVKAWSSSTSALGHVATSTIQRSCAACPAALSRVRRNAQRVREGWKSKSAFAQLISTTWPSKGETGNWPIGQLSYWASWAMGRNEGNQRPEENSVNKKDSLQTCFWKQSF